MSLIVRMLVSLLLLECIPAIGEASKALVTVEATDLSPGATAVLPGAFRVDEEKNDIIGLCILSNGVWLRVQPLLSPCAIVGDVTRPPLEQSYDMTAPNSDFAMWVIAHFGVTSEQWMRARKLRDDPTVADDNILKMIGRAADLRLIGNATRWTFESAALPNQLRTKIPGGGIFIHIGKTIPQAHVPLLFDRGTGALLVEAKLGMPLVTHTGAATTIVSIGVSMQTLDVRGELAPLPLIVGIYHSRWGYSKETTGSDGRNTYAASPLAKDATFIKPVAGELRSSPWEGRKLFSFTINPGTVTQLINAVNIARLRHDQQPLDARPSLVRLKGIDVRNESGSLDKGNIELQLDFQYLRVTQVMY